MGVINHCGTMGVWHDGYDIMGMMQQVEHNGYNTTDVIQWGDIMTIPEQPEELMSKVLILQSSGEKKLDERTAEVCLILDGLYKL